jgi:membrane protease YdiL (CAAX protease family)
MDSKYVEIADSQTRLRAAGHSLGIIVAAFVLGLGIGLAGLFVLGQFIPVYGPDDTLLPAPYLVSAALQFVGFLLIGVGYLLWADDRALVNVRLPTLRDVGLVLGGFGAIFVANIGLSYLIRVLGLETAENSVITAGRSNPEVFLLMVPISLLLVGPGEELLFRGIVQGLFKRAYGPLPAILIASALFGVVHYLALSGSGKIVYVAVAAILGLVLGTVYELSDNIAVPALAHGVWNSYLFLGQWVSVASGVELVTVIS